MELQRIKEIYEKTAEKYDELVTPCRMCQFLTLIHELNLKGNERVLEVGSGPGALSIELGKLLRRGEVIGIDISESMVKLAAQKASELALQNVKFLVGNALSLEFPNESFDIVVTSQLLHWVPDVRQFLSEIHRVLKADGKMGLISPTPEVYVEVRQAYQKIMEKYKKYDEGTKIQEMIGVKIYSEKETRELLNSAGFTIIKNFVMNFKEPVTPETYIKRIDAITDEKYLDPLPKAVRNLAKEELMDELAKLSKDDLKTTECSFFIVAYKEKRTNDRRIVI